MKKYFRSKKAFTLIELLVVVAIIGVLSTVVLVSFNGSREKTRDARRKSDLHQISTLLELYKIDKGSYPPLVIPAGMAGSATLCGSNGYDCNEYFYSFWVDRWAALSSYLAPYSGVPSLPVDPKNNGCAPWDKTTACYAYAYGNVGNSTHEPQYDLVARLENPDDPDRCGLKHYKYAGGVSAPIDWCGDYPAQLYEASPK